MNRLGLAIFTRSEPLFRTCTQSYAKFAGGKLGGGVSKKGGKAVAAKVDIPVETDTEKLVQYCCGLNILKTGGEEVTIKADSEYPEWLWELSLDKGPELEDMDQNTMEYWMRKRRIALRFKNKQSRKEFPKPFIPKKVLNMKLA